MEQPDEKRRVVVASHRDRALQVRYIEGMETVQIALPAELLKTANLDWGDVSQEAARLIALELFREEKVSLGRAAELCHTPLAIFMDFVAKHGVSPIRYGIGELEEDRQIGRAHV